MKMNLSDSIRGRIVSEDTAKNISEHYKNNQKEIVLRFSVIFSTIAAVCIGIGIILLLEYNWSYFTPSLKIAFAMLLLSIGLICCGLSLFKFPTNKALSVSSAMFTSLAIGFSLFVVSQTYHTISNVGTILFYWAMLCIPVLYLMRSTITLILSLLLCTTFLVYNYYYPEENLIGKSLLLFYGYLLLVFPYYIFLIRHRRHNNALNFLHWIFSLSIGISFLFWYSIDNLISASHIVTSIIILGILNLYHHFGSKVLKERNPWSLLSSIVTASILVVYSFGFENLMRDSSKNSYIGWAIILILAAISCFAYIRTGKQSRAALYFVFFASIPVAMFVKLSTLLAVVWINGIILAWAILSIQQGVKNANLKTSNWGFVLISVLIICRYFDYDISILGAGILFLSIGIGFLMANLIMLSHVKRKRIAHV